MRTGKRRLLRRILLAILLIAATAVVANFELIVYGISQARGQLNIVWQARPVENYLADPLYPDSLKQKLRFIDEVRAFAIDSLGLRDTRNYRTLYDQKGKEVMWVVTASERFHLRPHYWKFPILGAVPYKGFFNEESALRQARKLAAEGWDVNVRNPGGWSTLGWFTDPILSKMLERDEGDLASLIIHEMVHATIFVKDSVDFNENLASFIGDRGAELFLISNFGPESEPFLDFIHDDSDYVVFVDHVLRGTQHLDSLYTAMENEPVSAKQRLKEAMIRRIVQTMDTLTLYSGRKPARRFRRQLPNNAYFMSYIHYQSGQDDLERVWREDFGGDLKAYIAFLRQAHPFL